MKQHIAVIGAGAFGSFTAYQLAKMGHQITVFDAWGPGHSRASSGGETRVIRSVYGADECYVNWVADAYREWVAFEKEWNKNIFTQTGNLWLFSTGNDAYARRAMPLINAAGLSIEERSVTDVEKRFPAINFSDVQTVFFEKEAGFLYARNACQYAIEALVKLGGIYQQKTVEEVRVEDGEVKTLRLSDGSNFKADRYLFACGPWLKNLFPKVLKAHLQISRQLIGYYGTPAGDANFHPPQLPVWIDYGAKIYYGIPGAANRGFKLADDTRGTDFEPTTGKRLPVSGELATHLHYLKHRFPKLESAPLIEARVCQYTNSPDGDFIIDRHPEAQNAWLAGAGCGHAFKMAPVLGKYIAKCLLEVQSPNPKFQLNRFSQTKPVKTQFEV